MRPLIVTLALAAADQARFDALRQAHFPPERNHLAAHVTLFHALPGEQHDKVRSDLAEVARVPAYDLQVTRVRSLGRGVAYDLRAAELDGQHRELARRWEPELTSQDRRGGALAACRPVDGVLAVDGPGTGLALWRYLGGSWEPVTSFDFAEPGGVPEPT